MRILAEAWFVAGAQDGSLALYHSSKKKPVSVVQGAHGEKADGQAAGACFCLLGAFTG